MINDPYCSHCGYNLTGCTESSKCPECGKPLVEVLTRKLIDPVKLGYSRRYQSSIMLFGLPLIHIAMGPGEDGPKGKARGILAIGDSARGLIAMGGVAQGIVAFGGLAMGIFSIGGLGLGLFTMAGLSIGGITYGGVSIGAIACGGGAAGYIATGGASLGYYAAGGGVYGKYIIAPYRRDPEALALFQKMSWLTGNTSLSAMYRPILSQLLVLFTLLILIGALMLWAYLRHQEPPPDRTP